MGSLCCSIMGSVSHASMSVYSSLEVSFAVGVCPPYLPANTYITTRIQPVPECGCVRNADKHVKMLQLQPMIYTLNFSLGFIHRGLNDFALTAGEATKGLPRQNKTCSDRCHTFNVCSGFQESCVLNWLYSMGVYM